MKVPSKIDRFAVLDKIADGSFGPVHLGRDESSDRQVVIKLCALQDQGLRQRFFTEAEMAAKLRHDHIVEVLAAGLIEEIPYQVQAFLPGEDLAQGIAERQPWRGIDKLQILQQVAQGLAYAHSQGISHLDLKPSKIRLSGGVAKVMDFGTSRLASSETRSTQRGVTLATASYLPPEQVRSAPLDHRVDVFAFGALAYELFTYQRPFRGQTLSALVYQILYKEPVAMRSIWPECPEILEKLLTTCLAKDRELRYVGFPQLLVALQNIHKEAAAGRYPALTTVLSAQPTIEDPEDVMSQSMITRTAVSVSGPGAADTPPPVPPPVTSASTTVPATPVSGATDTAATQRIGVLDVEASAEVSTARSRSGAETVRVQAMPDLDSRDSSKAEVPPDISESATTILPKSTVAAVSRPKVGATTRTSQPVTEADVPKPDAPRPDVKVGATTRTSQPIGEAEPAEPPPPPIRSENLQTRPTAMATKQEPSTKPATTTPPPPPKPQASPARTASPPPSPPAAVQAAKSTPAQAPTSSPAAVPPVLTTPSIPAAPLSPAASSSPAASRATPPSSDAKIASSVPATGKNAGKKAVAVKTPGKPASAPPQSPPAVTASPVAAKPPVPSAQVPPAKPAVPPQVAVPPKGTSAKPAVPPQSVPAKGTPQPQVGISAGVGGEPKRLTRTGKLALSAQEISALIAEGKLEEAQEHLQAMQQAEGTTTSASELPESELSTTAIPSAASPAPVVSPPPKGTSPKAASPKPVTPKAAPPKAAPPKAAPPKPVTPKPVTPKAAPPKAATPKTATPGQLTLDRSEAPPAPTSSVKPPSGRNPIVLWLGLGVLVLALLAAAGWWFLKGRDVEVAPPVAVVPQPRTAPAPEPGVTVVTGRVEVDASPWATITEITDDSGYLVDLPVETVTPLFLDLPEGTYHLVLGGGVETTEESTETSPLPDGTQVVDEALAAAASNWSELQSCEVEVVAGTISKCWVTFEQSTVTDYFKEAGWWQ